MKIGVLGAGLSGLTSALLLQNKGYQVTVFEQEAEAGGLARTRKVKGHYFDMGGGHIFNSKTKMITDWVFSVLPAEKWKYSIRKAKISYKDKLIDYPFELALGQLVPDLAADCIVELINAQRGPEPDNFYDWLIWKFGKTIAEEYLIPYNQKTWSYDLKEIATDWIRGKLPTPDLKRIIYAALAKDSSEREMVHSTFYYPWQGGIGAFSEAISNQIVDLRCNAPVNFLKMADNKWVVNKEFVFDKIISTIPLPELAKAYLFPEEIADAVSRLRHKSTTIALFDAKVDPDISWIYFPGEEKYNKLSYASNFSDASLPMIIADLPGKLSKQDIESLGVGELVDYHYSEYSYPISSVGCNNALAKVFGYLKGKNIYLVGRFAEWQYYNMDKSIESAFKCVGGL